MELYQLEYFRAIVVAKNLQEAAEQLHVTQPSLSRCIKSLEQEFGTELFDRVGRNLQLNNAGEVVLQYANKTLDSAAEIKRNVDAYLRDKEQTLNMYAPVPLGEDEAFFWGFKERYPEIILRIGVAPAERLVSETPDLTFFANSIWHDEPNYLCLGEEEYVVIVSKDSPFANQSSITLRDLVDETFILPMPCDARDLIDGMFLEAGFEPRVFMGNQAYDQIYRSVALGYGVALIPGVTWFSRGRTGAHCLTLTDVHRKRYLYLKWAEGAVLPRAARLMRDYAVDHFRNLAQTNPFFTLNEELATSS